MSASIHQGRLVGRSSRLAGLGLVCAPILLAVTMTTAQAQGAPGPSVFYSGVEPLATTIGRRQADPRPQSADGKLQAADWLISAGLGWGGAYDSNVNASSVNRQSVYGASFQPSVLAERNTGIQRTLLYLNGDIRYYPSISRVDLNGTRAGLVHVWEIERDLIYRVQGEVAEVQTGSSFNNFLTTGLYATTPVNYTQVFGSTSIQKEFGSFFTAIGGSITGTKYRNSEDNLGNTIDEQFQNGTVTTLNGRFGYHVSPVIYTYIEPSVNQTRYNAASLNSNGYRVTAGIGSDLISLFKGELFGGYLAQKFDDPLTGDVTSPIFGGRVSWFPTRFITLNFSADQTFGTTDFKALAFTPGSTTKITYGTVNGQWDFSERFGLTAGYSIRRFDYLNSERKDDLSAIKAGIIYKVTPLLGIELAYLHQQLSSNFPGASYTRDLVTLGGSSKF